MAATSIRSLSTFAVDEDHYDHCRNIITDHSRHGAEPMGSTVFNDEFLEPLYAAVKVEWATDARLGAW